MSFGLDLRERFKSLNAATFGVGGIPIQNYVLDREYIHANMRPNQNWQIFIQLQDDYAPGKSIITPVDRDPLDLAQGFVTYSGDLAGGGVKVRVGRPGDGLQPAAFRLDPGWSQCAPGLRCGLARLGEGPVAHHHLLE